MNGWKEVDLPHKGWQCSGINDLGDVSGKCYMCGTPIRYEHTMLHPDVYESIECGCVCAGLMEEDPKQAKERESNFKKEERKRLKRQIENADEEHPPINWKISAKGNYWCVVDDVRVVIREVKHGFKIDMFVTPTNEPSWGTKIFPSIEKAKAVIESIK